MSDSEDSNDSCSFAVGSLIIDIDAQIDGPRNPQLSSSQKMNSKPVVEANKANNVEKAKADGAGKPTSLKNNNEHELGPKKTNKPLENGDKVKSAAQKGGFVGTGGSNLRGASASMREPKQNSAPAHLKSAKNRPSAQATSPSKTSTGTGPKPETKAAQVESTPPPAKKKKTSNSQASHATERETSHEAKKSGSSSTAGPTVSNSDSAHNSGSAGGGASVPPKAKTSVNGEEALNAAQVAANASSPPKNVDSNAEPEKKVATKDAETITEAEILAPCETGTEVHLSGIIWHETDGMVVVNVTWRNRSYIGTLLDSSKHDYAPPRLGDGGETDDASKPGRRKGRQKPVKNSRNSRPGENGTVPVAGRKNKREPEPSSDTDNGKPGPKKPRTNNGRGTPVHENSEKEKSEADGSSAVQSLACHFKDCHKKFKKQEALQYHIDEHRRKTAETEKEQNKKDKKENQENTKGDKSDNEINAALGLAALGQLSDQKEGGSGPPSLTKGSKGRPQSVENVVAPPPPPLLQKQPAAGQGSLPPMPVLTPKPGLSFGNNGAPSPIPNQQRRPNQLSPSLDESGMELFNGSAAAPDSTSPKSELSSTVAPSVISLVVQSDPNVPISVPTAQNAVPGVIDPSRGQTSPSASAAAADIPPRLERRPTSPFHPVKPEVESPSQCARVSPSAYSDISDPGDEAPPESPAKAKDEKIPKVQEEMTSVLYSNYQVANPSMKSHLLINRDEKKNESRKLDSKNYNKIAEVDKVEPRLSALGSRPKTHQTEGNKPTATIQPTKQETKPPLAKPGKEKHVVSSPGTMPSGMPLPAAFAHMPFATNMNPEYMRYQQGLSYVVPTTVAPVGHFPYLPGLQTPFQPPVQTKQRIDGKSRDAARSGSPIKQHSVHPMYSSAGLMHPGHQGLQSYGYGGPLHQNTNKK